MMSASLPFVTRSPSNGEMQAPNENGFFMKPIISFEDFVFCIAEIQSCKKQEIFRKEDVYKRQEMNTGDMWQPF